MTPRVMLCALLLALAASGVIACEGYINLTTWTLTCTGPCSPGTCHEVSIYDPDTGRLIAHYCTCDAGDAPPEHCYLKHYRDAQGAHHITCMKDCENPEETCTSQPGPIMGTVKCDCD
jgi:hypothetical protein